MMACPSMKGPYGFIRPTTLANADLSLPDAAVVFNAATCPWRPHTHTDKHSAGFCVGLKVTPNIKAALEHKLNIRHTGGLAHDLTF